MPEMIRDGGGTGYLAGVNSQGRLLARATSVEQRLKATLDADYYEATTTQVTLTDAAETGIIYIYNGDTNNRVIVVDKVFIDVWASTNGVTTDGGILKYHKNPAITGGTDIVPNNTNFNDQTAALGTFKKSLTTLSGTVWWTGFFVPMSSITVDEGKFLINPGRSFGITLQAPTGNTSMKVSINIAFYYLDLKSVGEDR
jgi:hypothetical protein